LWNAQHFAKNLLDVAVRQFALRAQRSPTPISTFYFCWERKSGAGIAAAYLRIFADFVGHRISRELGGAHLGKSASGSKRTTRSSTWHCWIADFWRAMRALREAGHESAAGVGKAGAALSAGANSKADQGTIGALRKYDFHLEPNVKESPGGLRDYQATIWLRRSSKKKRGFATSLPRRKSFPRPAVDFLSAIRCFLHYSNGRNDNTLTYELAGSSGRTGAGRGRRRGAKLLPNGCASIFRHARTLNRQLLRYLEQKAPSSLTLRQRLFQRDARRQARAGR